MKWFLITYINSKINKYGLLTNIMELRKWGRLRFNILRYEPLEFKKSWAQLSYKSVFVTFLLNQAHKNYDYQNKVSIILQQEDFLTRQLYIGYD